MGEVGTDIKLAEDVLRKNDCVAIPTETVYGLAANALHEHAVAKIFTIKKRPVFDPLIVHIADADQISDFVTSVPGIARDLAAAFWPGPLTLLLPKRNIIPDITTSGLSSVGLRVPNHPLTLSLLYHLPFPLAAPSANPFGYISPTSALHVKHQLGNDIQYILDGGECIIGLESTIIDLSVKEPVVRRWGGITAEMLYDFLGNIKADDHSSSNPLAPGMLHSHYAPTITLYAGHRMEIAPKMNPADCATISFTEPWPSKCNLILSPTGDLGEAARNLFRYMRELDLRDDIKCIYSEWVPNKGIGVAINDKLRRASHR